MRMKMENDEDVTSRKNEEKDMMKQNTNATKRRDMDG